MSRNKKILIITVSVLASALILTAVLGLVFSRLEIAVGKNGTQTVEVFDSYSSSSPKAYVRVLGLKFPVSCESKGEIDTNKTGEYTIDYTASFLWKTLKQSGTVNVVDSKAPTIELEDYNFNFEYISAPPTPDDIKVKFTANDNYDGDITDSVVKTVVDNICYFTVLDSSGNEAAAEVNIIYTDGMRPTISLMGDTTMYLAAGNQYYEPGFSAKDNIEGDITASVKVNGAPDITKSGIYLIEYTVTDTAGNTARVTRRVVVYGTSDPADFQTVAPNGKTVYLTFDDGPGIYTEKLLTYLRKYDIKATFFVTNQFPRYQHLIKTAYDDGHTIGVHTYSHNIYRQSNNIYASVDAFMADFNAMQEVIKAQTGSYSKIFRFPGGTNNTISKKYCAGIMTALSGKLTAEGYYYFDWNCDCMDTSSAKTADAVIKNTLDQMSKKTNSIVLMHDIKGYTVEAIPAIIEVGLRRGYTFKALDESSPAIRYNPQN